MKYIAHTHNYIQYIGIYYSAFRVLKATTVLMVLVDMMVIQGVMVAMVQKVMMEILVILVHAVHKDNALTDPG